MQDGTEADTKHNEDLGLSWALTYLSWMKVKCEGTNYRAFLINSL